MLDKDTLALARDRDAWVDRWIRMPGSNQQSRRMLQEYLLDGSHAEAMPMVLRLTQERLLKELSA